MERTTFDAKQQTALTESELSISVQSNTGKAEYQRSVQQAAQIRALAIEEQVRAYGGPQLQLTQQVLSRFAEAVEQAKVDVVPKIVVGGGKDGAAGGSSLFESAAGRDRG